MNKKTIQLGAFIAIASAILLGLSACSKPDNYDVNIQTVHTASEGLDLRAVSALVMECENGEELEMRINSPGEGLNNLDLNENGKADYIKVTEYGENNLRGFSLTVDLGQGQEQEVAIIEIEKQGEQANVETHGNEQIYGQNHYHQSHFGFGDYLLLSYMFGRHPFYMSPWGYGRYPPSYSAYGTVNHRSYQDRVANTTAGSTFSQAKTSNIATNVKSPNQGKSASNIRAPLVNPTQTQKSFQTRNPSKQIKTGGFGRSMSKPSVKSSSNSRSGGFSRGK